jgi:hypothetical protein
MLDVSLFDGLEPAARRRFWLLELLIEKLEPSAALQLAAQMESFIRGENPATIVKVPELGPPPRPANAACVSATPDVFFEEQALSVPAPSRGSRLLQGKALQDFTNAVSTGLANAELACRFGITPRQANSLRMGIEKRLPHLRMTKVANPEKRGIDRVTELRMQEDF